MKPTDPPISSGAVDATVRAALSTPPAAPTAPVTGDAARAALEDYTKTIVSRVDAVAKMFESETAKLVDPTTAKEFRSVVRNNLIVASLNYVLQGVFKKPDALEDGTTIADSTDERMRQSGFVVSGNEKSLPEIANHPAGRMALELGLDPDRDPPDSQG